MNFRTTLHVLTLGILCFSLYACNNCNDYWDDSVATKSYGPEFVQEPDTFHFEGPNGEIVTLAIDSISHTRDGMMHEDRNDCVRNFQGISEQNCQAIGNNPSGKLNYQLTRHFAGLPSFAFSFALYTGEIANETDTQESLEINGVVYNEVYILNTTPDTGGHQLEAVYIAAGMGPVRYVFFNGDVWNRLP